jgi:hypothetical protein
VDALTERILALTREPELFPRPERPFEIEPIEHRLPAMGGTPSPAKWLGIKSARSRTAPQTEDMGAALVQTGGPTATEPLMFEIKPRRGGTRGGRPGSSA